MPLRKKTRNRHHSAAKVRDLIKQARAGEEGADMVATDAMLAAGYSTDRASKALQHRPIPESVRENVRRTQEKIAAKKSAAAARAAERVPANAHDKANDGINKLVSNRYFQHIPLDTIFEIVERAGFHFDPEEKLVMLTGRTGRATWELFGPTGKPANHMLVMTWYKMESTGRYEVVAYVS